MKRIGIYGGTFDPVHSGHLITAMYLKEIRQLDTVIFMPCFISPHKTGEQHETSKHRLAMLELALRDNPHFELSTFELDRAEVSYTITTVRHFRKYYEHLELIIGYDNLLSFESWKDPDELFQLAEVVVMKRLTDKEPQLKNKYYQKAVLVDTPYLEISSSELRKRVSEGKSIRYMVPQTVREYIQKHHLYEARH